MQAQLGFGGYVKWLARRMPKAGANPSSPAPPGQVPGRLWYPVCFLTSQKLSCFYGVIKLLMPHPVYILPLCFVLLMNERTIQPSWFKQLDPWNWVNLSLQQWTLRWSWGNSVFSKHQKQSISQILINRFCLERSRMVARRERKPG
jgi:hypothetical protein